MLFWGCEKCNKMFLTFFVTRPPDRTTWWWWRHQKNKNCNKLAKNGSKVTNNTIFLAIFSEGICFCSVFLRTIIILKITIFWWHHEVWRHRLFKKKFFLNIDPLSGLSRKYRFVYVYNKTNSVWPSRNIKGMFLPPCIGMSED